MILIRTQQNLRAEGGTNGLIYGANVPDDGDKKVSLLETQYGVIYCFWSLGLRKPCGLYYKTQNNLHLARLA